MNNVFLYLYPIEEFAKMLTFTDEDYKEWGRVPALKALNYTIDKRYRDKGYKIIYAVYRDKEIYGLDVKSNDLIINTDTTFDELSCIDDDGKEKQDFIPKYPDEDYLINQIGFVDKLIVGGYHFSDCVKRVAERAYDRGIDILVDLELTDLFFSLYYKNYFQIDNYDTLRYKNNRKESAHFLDDDDEFFEESFYNTYNSPVYGFYDDNIKVKAKIY